MRIYKEYLFASHYTTQSASGANENKDEADKEGAEIITWAEARQGDKAKANADQSKSHRAAFNLLIYMVEKDADLLEELIDQLASLPY